MQTTVSDLIQILTQLNTGNAAPAAAPALNVAAPAPNVAPAAPAAAPAPNVAPAAPAAAPAPNVAPAAPAAAPAPNIAPAAPAAAPAPNVAPAAPAAAPAPNAGNVAANAAPAAQPAAQIPFSAVFRCPSCDTVHFLGSVNTPAVANAAPVMANAAPAVPNTAAPVAGPAGNNQAGPSNAAGRWYSVTFGRQIGVFRDWYGVVDPLVNGVPGWRCKAFSTYAAAVNHFNTHFVAGAARVYTEPSVEAVDGLDAE